MKRIGYLHEKIYDYNNIDIADNNARKNKTKRWGIQNHDQRKELDNKLLSQLIKDLTYKTSEYDIFKIYEPKERDIFRLPYFPDRIAHHAIMNITEPIWTKIFIENTYSCIKGRGIYKLVIDLNKVLIKYPEETKYCLKLDIKKFYPSINHDVLYDIICKKIKDKKTLLLLKEIIYSADGVPIGNYLSQFFANLYLAYFDHWIKEEVKCKYYFRYCDDIVILGNDKNKLRNILLAIKIYIKHVLKLELKSNYQIFPVASRGIDFVGYKFYHTHILLRKSVKKNIFKRISDWKHHKITKEQLKRSLVSYFGWAKYCNSKNLLQQIKYKTGISKSNWNGKQVNISRFYNKYVYIIEVIRYSKYFRVNFMYNGKPYYFNSSNKTLLYSLSMNNFPTNFKITPYYEKYKKNRNEQSSSKNSKTGGQQLLLQL